MMLILMYSCLILIVEMVTSELILTYLRPDKSTVQEFLGVIGCTYNRITQKKWWFVLGDGSWKLKILLTNFSNSNFPRTFLVDFVSLILGIDHSFDSPIQLQQKLSHFTYVNFLKINKKTIGLNSLIQLQRKLSPFTCLKTVSFPGLTSLQSLHLPEANACNFKTLILIMSMISPFHSPKVVRESHDYEMAVYMVLDFPLFLN